MPVRTSPRPVSVAVTVAVLLGAGCATSAHPQEHQQDMPTARTSTEAPPPRSFTLVASGDVLPHDDLWAQARRDADGGREYDFRPLFADVRPIVRGADLAICHMETPFAPRGGPYEGYPTFSSPPQIAGALAWLGYDACSTASNHTLDQGFAGVKRTIRILEDAGIEPYGTARTRAESKQPVITRVNGVTVGLLAYTFSFNGIPEPEGKRWIADLIDPEKILADAARAERNGAQVVVVSLHWGDEYQHEITAAQRELAPRLLASADVDLLLGHHAHVVQPMERIDGEWVAYGLGNHVAAHETPVPANHEGAIAEFTFTEGEGGWTVTGAGYLATFITGRPPIRLLNVSAELSSSKPSAPRARLEKARRRTTRVIESRSGSGDSGAPTPIPVR